MIDTAVKYIPVIMLNEHLNGCKRYTLPEGYSFDFYSPETGVSDWICVQRAASALSGDGLEQLFRREFSDGDDMLARRMLFVRDKDGIPAATATLWHGSDLGADMPRLHWAATASAHQERGIMKALLTRLFDMSLEMGFSGMYLVSQTFSYAAINIYQQFGFKRVMTTAPASFKPDNPEDAMKEAWDIIDTKIEAYTKQRYVNGGKL